MNGIMKIFQAYEDSNILLKRITKTNEKGTKKQNIQFLGMLLGTLGAILLEKMLTGKAVLRVTYGNKQKLIPSHSLANIEIQKHCQNEPRFNRVYSRSNFPKAKKMGYIQ